MCTKLSEQTHMEKRNNRKIKSMGLAFHIEDHEVLFTFCNSSNCSMLSMMNLSIP